MDSRPRTSEPGAPGEPVPAGARTDASFGRALTARLRPRMTLGTNLSRRHRPGGVARTTVTFGLQIGLSQQNRHQVVAQRSPASSAMSSVRPPVDYWPWNDGSAPEPSSTTGSWYSAAAAPAPVVAPLPDDVPAFAKDPKFLAMRQMVMGGTPAAPAPRTAPPGSAPTDMSSAATHGAGPTDAPAVQRVVHRGLPLTPRRRGRTWAGPQTSPGGMAAGAAPQQTASVAPTRFGDGGAAALPSVARTGVADSDGRSASTGAAAAPRSNPAPTAAPASRDDRLRQMLDQHGTDPRNGRGSGGAASAPAPGRGRSTSAGSPGSQSGRQASATDASGRIVRRSPSDPGPRQAPFDSPTSTWPSSEPSASISSNQSSTPPTAAAPPVGVLRRAVESMQAEGRPATVARPMFAPERSDRVDTVRRTSIESTSPGRGAVGGTSPTPSSSLVVAGERTATSADARARSIGAAATSSPTVGPTTGATSPTTSPTTSPAFDAQPVSERRNTPIVGNAGPIAGADRRAADGVIARTVSDAAAVAPPQGAGVLLASRRAETDTDTDTGAGGWNGTNGPDGRPQAPARPLPRANRPATMRLAARQHHAGRRDRRAEPGRGGSVDALTSAGGIAGRHGAGPTLADASATSTVARVADRIAGTGDFGAPGRHRTNVSRSLDGQAINWTERQTLLDASTLTDRPPVGVPVVADHTDPDRTDHHGGTPVDAPVPTELVAHPADGRVVAPDRLQRTAVEPVARTRAVDAPDQTPAEIAARVATSLPQLARSTPIPRAAAPLETRLIDGTVEAPEDETGRGALVGSSPSVRPPVVQLERSAEPGLPPSATITSTSASASAPTARSTVAAGAVTSVQRSPLAPVRDRTADRWVSARPGTMFSVLQGNGSLLRRSALRPPTEMIASASAPTFAGVDVAMPTGRDAVPTLPGALPTSVTAPPLVARSLASPSVTAPSTIAPSTTVAPSTVVPSTVVPSTMTPAGSTPGASPSSPSLHTDQAGRAAQSHASTPVPDATAAHATPTAGLTTSPGPAPTSAERSQGSTPSASDALVGSVQDLPVAPAVVQRRAEADADPKAADHADAGPVAPADLADRFMAELARHRQEAARPLPIQFASIADSIVANRTPLISTGVASRKALAAVGKVAATTGDVIHLATAPMPGRPSAELRDIIAHELTHVAAPSPAPRFFDDDRHSAEETRATEIGALMRRTPMLPNVAAAASGTIRRMSAPVTHDSSPAIRRFVDETPGASVKDLTAKFGNRPTTRPAQNTNTQAAPAAQPEPTPPSNGASAMPQNAEPQSVQAWIDPADFEKNLRNNFDLIVELLEDRIIADLERRGGRFRGEF